MTQSEQSGDVVKRDDLKVFLSQAAHELNNVLSIIDGAARFLARNPPPDKIVEYSERIHRAVKRGSELSATLSGYCNPGVQAKKVLEGNQLSFKVVGVAAIIVGDSLYEGILRQNGFTLLHARDADDALMVQDDYDGDIDILVWALGNEDGEDYREFKRLYSSLREKTEFVSEGLEREEFLMCVFNAVDAALTA